MAEREVAIIDSQPVARLGLEAALRRTGLRANAFHPSQPAVTALLSGQLSGQAPDVLVVDDLAVRLIDSLGEGCREGRPLPRLVLFGDGELPTDAPRPSCRVSRDAELEVVLAAVAAGRGGSEQPEGELTQRETEVLTLAAEGHPSAAIARRLFISPGTVKLHLHHAYRKLGAPNRAAAVCAALQAGLIAAPAQAGTGAPSRAH